MTERVGLMRNAAGLREARDTIDQLCQSRSAATSGSCNRLLVARLIAEAAFLRTETRGVHTREDFPGADPNWQKHIVLKKDAEPECVGL